MYLLRRKTGNFYIRPGNPGRTKSRSRSRKKKSENQNEMLCIGMQLACLLENSTWWLRSSSIADESAIFWKREHKNTIGGIAVKIISRLFPVNFLQINIITWFSIMSTRANRKVRFYSLLLMFFILLVFYSPREGRSERESECRLQCPNGGEWNQIAETWFSYLSRKQFPFHVVQRIFTYILPLCNQDNSVRYWLRRS